MSRGSEWRRWEFHMHTPGTKKEDRYAGASKEEKWEKFYSDIAEYIGDGSDPAHDICAIAITDYLSIDNYLKICRDNKLPDSVKFIFPNVELRMVPIASSSPINIHCLFDPDIAGELEDRFFAKLKFEFKESTYSATKSELIRLGRDFCGDLDLSEQKAYIEGLNQYVLNYNMVSSVFKNDSLLRGKTIIVVSNKSKDGVSGLRTHSDYFEGEISQLDATRRAIYQLADAIFSSNDKDIKYFLGEGSDDQEFVIRKCGSLMPCIHGSDAHSNDRIFAPDEDRFCWIKADPTFEGLKQILYEPKERVKIGSTMPDSKPSYYVIDRVEIKENESFSPEPIYFSDKLTCIIGGKSTGKSLLLHNMAMAIDREQVESKEEIASTNVKQIPEMEVCWRDNVSSSDPEKQRKIVYIPQTYLNRLSDEDEETTEIDEIIQEIILQDPASREEYENFQKKLSDKKMEITNEVVTFENIVGEIERFKDKCKEIGDEEAITLEITKLTEKLEKLGNHNITEEEIKRYQSSIEEKQGLQGKLDKLSDEQGIIQDINSIVEIIPRLIDDIAICEEIVTKAAEEVKSIADKTWHTCQENILSEITKQRDEAEKALEQVEKTISELQPKVEENEQIRVLADEISKEQARLDSLKEMNVKLREKQVLFDDYVESLSRSFDDFSNIYQEYVDSINERICNLEEDLEFSVEKVFRTQHCTKKILEILNKKSISKFKEFDLQDIDESVMSPANIAALIQSILHDSKESLQLKSTYTVEAALREILTDWYNVAYIVKMDNDSIQDMSPGKKALVLLRLLISLAESNCPILIDQPEDDLDNRSIFDELIRFIKEKKIDRQIITVTHNANIVLGGDAELVIVANQNGNNAPNKQYRFEYRGGAIEDNLPIVQEDASEVGILNSKGIQEHICDILEGGKHAFALRQQKYHFLPK